jgi:hypothetical protein
MLRFALYTTVALTCVVALPKTLHGQVAVSGLIFGSYNYQMSTSPAQLPSQVDNAFLLDRAYLNFRAPAGDRVSIRVTTDIYQTTEASANAYTLRAKYAYFQYDAPKSSNGSQLIGRLGILQNVTIEHIETFWPRYLSQAAIERAGYFSSADVGLAAQYSLPARLGEVYATVVNGPGYQSRERDRFKDMAVRLSLTPFAGGRDTTLFQTLTLTGWLYKGATASSFVNSGPVGEAMDRSRAGLFIGIKDPRLVLAAEVAQRHDESDAGTSVALRTQSSITGRLLSAFTVVRPLAFGAENRQSPLGVVLRYDHVTPTSSTEGLVPAPSSSNAYHTFIGGVFYELSSKAVLALDYQESLNAPSGTTAAPLTQSKVYYLHFKVDF